MPFLVARCNRQPLRRKSMASIVPIDKAFDIDQGLIDTRANTVREIQHRLRALSRPIRSITQSDEGCTSLAYLSVFPPLPRHCPQAKAGEMHRPELTAGCHGIGPHHRCRPIKSASTNESLRQRRASDEEYRPSNPLNDNASCLARYFGKEAKVNTASAKDLQGQLES